MESSEERWWCPELHRFRAVFLSAMGAEEVRIETSFHEAIRTAKEQKSVSLEKSTTLKTWTAWNHVRAVAALAAAALFTLGLCRASSPFDLTRSQTPSRPMSTILPHKPEDWPQVFEQHLNAGDLDAVMALYDPEARFVTRSGETLVGREAIREALGSIIKAKTQLHSRVVWAVTVEDIAQLYTDFEGTTVDSSGKQRRFITRLSRFCAARPMAVGS